jgi:hypothetical protein
VDAEKVTYRATTILRAGLWLVVAALAWASVVVGLT